MFRWLRTLFKPIPFKIRKLTHLPGSEAKFLAGKHSRLNEFFRVIRIALEFIRGFQAFHFLPPSVTVFGSARFKEGHRYYELARQTAALVAQEGFVIVTGGGPGIMEAANRGAREAVGYTVGANIRLPIEQHPNPYLNKWVNFHYFFVRKVILIKYSIAFIVMPGGFGTIDELFEALTLIQTGKLYRFPVILMGKDYWKDFADWLEIKLSKEGTIAAEDLKYLTITDDPQEALQAIRDTADALSLKIQQLTPNI